MIDFNDIQVGDTIVVHTSWGTGELVTGTVRGKEKLGKNEQDVVDYYVDGNKFENWCYIYQVKKLIKEKE